MRFRAVIDSGRSKSLEIEQLEGGKFRVEGVERQVDIVVAERGVYSFLIDGASYEVSVRDEKGRFVVEVAGHLILVRLEDPLKRKVEGTSAHQEGEAVISSPMPGRVVGIKAQVGQPVKAGEGVILIEAMKMENDLHSPKTGTVKTISVKVGEAVEAGQELVVIE